MIDEDTPIYTPSVALLGCFIAVWRGRDQAVGGCDRPGLATNFDFLGSAGVVRRKGVGVSAAPATGSSRRYDAIFSFCDVGRNWQSG